MTRRARLCLCLACAAVPAFAATARAQPPVQEASFTAPRPADNDLFGYAVAVAGDTVVVGVPGRRIHGHAAQGEALVFVRPPGGWAGPRRPAATLIASDGGQGDGFGYSVAVAGDTIVVGAPGLIYGRTRNAGAAYVFTRPRAGWAGTPEQTARLTAPGAARNDQLGYSVALADATVVAGAPNHRVAGQADAGAAYVFRRPRSGWAHARRPSATLTGAPAATSAYVGWSVAVTADAIAVGAQGLHDHRGAAYVFARPGGGWRGRHTPTTTLSAPGAPTMLGYSVAMAADTVVAGAPGLLGPGRGAAYVFVEPASGWPRALTPAASLSAPDRHTATSCGLPPDRVPGSGFALRLALAGDTIVVGEAGHGTDGVEYDTACLFTKPAAGWAGSLTDAVTLLRPAAAASPADDFGGAVAFDGATLVVGADGQRVAGRDAGAVYVY